MADFSITDLSGGYNDTDAPTSLAPNQCTVATNVDFFKSPCGSRRPGCTPITLAASLAGKTITFLYRHLPTGDESASQLWAYGVSGGVGTLSYKDTSWHDVNFVDADDPSGYFLFQLQAVSFHGKLFLAYRSVAGIDRLHVWDGTTLRRVGLAPPTAAPTAVDTGVGTFGSTRYYRTRETKQVAGTTILRSEPTSHLTFSPSGTGSGATVSRPTLLNTETTHWELEASLDNTLFYVIATVAIGLGSSLDTASASAGYASFELSEDVGDYELPRSARYLLVDQDRLIMAGNFESDLYASVVSWTPVFNDPGTGNDERVPIDTNNTLNLDGYEGGRITGMVGPINGVIYVFKKSHIYRLIRTGQRESAYEPVALSKARGALDSSIVEAVDESGRPALYFLDPRVGPCRLGTGGLIDAGADILNTWARVNVSNTLVVAKSLFDPKRRQIHWWIAVDGLGQPTERITLQIDATRETPDGLRYGWSRHTGAAGRVAYACLYASNIEANTTRSYDLDPFFAVDTSVLMLDEDATTDGAEAIVPEIITRPTILSGSLNNRFGVRAGSVCADADDDAVLGVSLIKDFGVEESTAVDLSLAPAGTEDPVIVTADSLRISECRAVQVRLTDGEGNTGRWSVQRIDLVPRSEQSS